MRQIAAFVKKQGWRQVEAAQHGGVTQPRINDLLRGDLLRGRVSRFSLEALVNISTALGCRVRVDLEAA
jgi:predicted XRE-type DNA-binding protein